MTGRVKFWNATRCWGFIEPDQPDGQGDYFVHVTGIHGGIKELVPGDHVEFEPAATERGRAAIKVRILK